MNDARCSELLPAYLEGSLPAAQHAAVEAHLSASVACRDELARLRRLDAWLAELPGEADVRPEVTQAILSSTVGAATARVASTEDESHPPIPLRPRRRLLWATAAAVLITAVLAWWLSRPSPSEGNEPVIAEHDDRPDRVTRFAARLVVGETVGRAPTGATVRIYAPSLARLFYDLTLMRIDPAMSFNNVRIARETPYRDVTVDDEGRIALDQPLGTGSHLAFVEAPGYVGTWGLIDAVDVAPTLEVPLLPARDVRVHGTVTTESGDPVPGAIIATPDGHGTGATGEQGHFDFVARVPSHARPWFHVLADGFVPIRRREAADATDLSWDVTLKASPRRDIEVTLTDAEGRPLRSALVLLRRTGLSGPNVGMTDADGKFRFRSMLQTGYRMTVSHERAYLRDHLIEAEATEVTRLALRVPDDGDARCTVRVTGRSAAELAGTRAIVTFHDDLTRLVDRRLDLEATAQFPYLRGGEPSLQLFTTQGFGYFITFPLDASDVASFDYPLPPNLHTVHGHVDPDAYTVIRLQGDLPRIQVGRRKSLAHRFAVETMVGPDGSFAFPALPRLKNVLVFGRARADHQPERLFGDRKRSLDTTDPKTVTLER